MTDSAAPIPDSNDAPVQDETSLSPFVVRQHMLNHGPSTVLEVTSGAHILDVQMIDGSFALRTVEDESIDGIEEVEIRAYALGGRLSGKLTHIPARAGGVHFFVVDRDLNPVD